MRGRTHRCKVLGIGHQRSRGVKAGAIVDLDAAENAIRLAIDAAERMAGVEVESVIVNMSGGRLSSQLFAAKIAAHGKAVGEYEVHRVLEAASAASACQGRAVLHAVPTGYRLDAQRGVHDPKGMVGDELDAELHVASCDAAAARNLMLAIERCHLRVAAVVATPYAAGLSTLVDDEAELGAALIDFGGGSTTVGVFAGDRLVHLDAVAVGGNHITMDVARGPLGQPRRRRASEDAVRRLHRLAFRRSRIDRGASRSATTWIIRLTCRSRNWCASSARASRKFSNLCATGCARPATPPTRDGGSC